MERHPEVTVGVSVNDRAGLARMEAFIGKLRPVVKTVYGRTADHALIADILALKPRKFYLLYRDALDPSQLCETVPFDQFIEAVRKRFDPAAVGTVFCLGFLPDRETYPVLAQTRCPAGTTKLGIMPDGSVYPCNLFFGLQEFRLGNILTDPFERIWRHPALSFFRTFAGNPCSRMSCSLHSACHGGCPAHSLMLCGSVGAPDPRCG
jgi:radical SAM protein with 4Fe4S-binding SPASM domain